MRERIGEGFRDSQALQGVRRDAGDEFAADPVARIRSRLVEGHGEAVIPEGNGEGEPAEPASDDRDRFRQAMETITASPACEGYFLRATMRMDPRQSVVSVIR